jgi:hypothetical protein
MIWLAWRQLRTQVIAAAAALAVLAIVLIITGLAIRHQYTSAGLPGCQAHHDCEALATAYLDQLRRGHGYQLIFFGGMVLLYLVPALIGLFWGAPLIAREFETGTIALAWNQSISRNRWLAAKLGLVGLAAMATAGLLSLLITWWADPVDRAIGYAGTNAVIGVTRLDPTTFGARGIVPIGYAAFALVLGVAAGVLIRRTVPAMVTTLAVFAAVQLIWPNWIRPHLIPPTVVKTPLTDNFAELSNQFPGNQMTVVDNWYRAGALVLSNQTVTRSGQLFTGPSNGACQGNSMQACDAWLNSKHLLQVVSYQPASRFWAFQWYETAIFLALAAALAAFSAWQLNRRRLA